MALDRMIPDVASRVHDRQLNQKAGHDRGTKQRTFVAGEEVGAKNFTSATPKWLREKIVHCRGPVSYDIELEDQRVVRRHADHLQKNTLPCKDFDSGQIPRVFMTLLWWVHLAMLAHGNTLQ